MKRFGDRYIARFLQRSDMRGQVSVGHIEGIAHLRERELGRSGQHGHNRQPPFLVNDAIELEEWFGVHVSFLRFSVK